MKKYLIILIFLLSSLGIQAQIDSLQLQKLMEVEVVSKERPLETSIPIQVIGNQELQSLPTLQVSDALKYLSGVVIKDYGGVGGMKTVSVRGLGSQHTGVAYDGIPLSDCQTGQIDLSKISMQNVNTLSLQSGRGEDIFVPARLFASASVINITTQKPVFKNKPINLDFSFTGGSFGLINPYLLIENRIKKAKKEDDSYYAWSLKTEYLQSDGNYPYDLHYGGQSDSVSHEHRSNSDVRNLNAEINFFAKFNAHSELNAKAYYYISERGLPGATIYYNLESSQRLSNQNAFGQIHYQNYFTPKIGYQVNAKFNYDETRYLDPDYHNAEGKLDNKYLQREYYLSNAVIYKPFKQWNISLSNDIFYNNMNANTYEFSQPERLNCLTVLATTFSSKHIQLFANILNTLVWNKVKYGETAANENHWSPSAGFSIKPIQKENFIIRFFYKNIFRMPTFNDLYYREVGNVNLQAEKTNQFDFGLSYDKSWRGSIDLSAAADIYYNMVKDKIIAIPNRNLFIWTMLNYGKVDILGVDVHCNFSYKITRWMKLSLGGTYSYQRAQDLTDENSKTYGQQIPYTPLHSGSAFVTIDTKWISVGYSFVASGIRYSLGQNIAANQLDPYADQSIFIAHDFNIKNQVILGFKAEILNIADAQYEIVRNYPMQGRSFRIKLTLKY